jgi:hypothetical protein
MNQLMIATRDDSLKLKQVYPVIKTRKTFHPATYMALAKDTTTVFPWFRIECRQCFQQMDRLPSFSDDKGTVVLLDKNLKVIDEFRYSDKMHSQALNNIEGISLERVSADEDTNASGNWHSASSLAGFGTPGYRNSQDGIPNITRPEVFFEPESFSPNLDGYNDVFNIRYRMDKPGYICNVSIFDSNGRFVVQPAKNQTLGSEGTIIWNGQGTNAKTLTFGVYVVFVELFHSDGKVLRFKDGVVLTGHTD